MILSIVDSPLDALNDTGSGPFAVVTENLDGNEVAPLGHAIFCSPDDSGDMCSMAVLIRVWRARDGVGAQLGAAAKVLFLFRWFWLTKWLRNEEGIVIGRKIPHGR